VAQYFQSFVGLPQYSPPQGWVGFNTAIGGENSKVRIDTDVGSEGGTKLKHSIASNGSVVVYYPAVHYENSDEIEFFAKVRFDSYSAFPHLFTFFTDPSGGGTGLTIACTSSNIHTVRLIVGTNYTVDSYSYSFNNTTYYKFRVRCNWPSKTIKVKVWDSAVTTEPADWTLSSSLADPAFTVKGYSGLGYSGDGYVVSYIGIGTNGDSAPIGPVPFPEVKGVKTLEVPQKILREPRLLTPKKQPNWPVKVDKTNSLTKDLAFCMVPPNPVNIARSNRGYSIDTSLPPVGTGVGGTGLLWRGAGGIYGAHHGGGYVLTSASWSWFIMCNHTYTAEYAEILAFWNGVPFAASYTIKIGKYGGYLTAQSWGGADTNIVATSSLNGQLQSVGGQINSDVTNGSVIWFEGIKKTGTAKTITQSTLSGTASTTSFYYFPSASNIHRLPNLAELGVVYVWNRCISDEEMKSISLDPYQILAPA
jgi:hypothetical protein